VRYLIAALIGCLAVSVQAAEYTTESAKPLMNQYYMCGATKASTLIDTPGSAIDIAKTSVRSCDKERLALLKAVRKENSSRPHGNRFADSYVKEEKSKAEAWIASGVMEARAKKAK
jgi:hypothetical protein